MEKVNIRKNFPKSLSTGKVFVVQSYLRESKIAPVAVQFAQQIIKESSDPVLALQLGGNIGTIVTTTKNFTIEQAKKLRLNSGEEQKVFNDQNVIFANDISNIPLEISVIENTTKNELLKSQTPKINPATGEILTFESKPIYVHTNLVPKEKLIRSFLQSDNLNVSNSTPIVSSQRLNDLIK